MEKKYNWMEYIRMLEENGIHKLYHFTDRDNLESIIKNGGLYSWADCRDKDIRIPKPGGSQQSRSLDTRDGLQYYVRLSFTKQHPMMFVAMNDGRMLTEMRLKMVPMSVNRWMISRRYIFNLSKPKNTLTCLRKNRCSTKQRCW